MPRLNMSKYLIRDPNSITYIGFPLKRVEKIINVYRYDRLICAMKAKVRQLGFWNSISGILCTSSFKHWVQINTVSIEQSSDHEPRNESQKSAILQSLVFASPSSHSK